MWKKGTPQTPGQYLVCVIRTYHDGKDWLERKTLVWNPYNQCWDSEDGNSFYCDTEDVYCWTERPDPPEYNKI